VLGISHRSGENSKLTDGVSRAKSLSPSREIGSFVNARLRLAELNTDGRNYTPEGGGKLHNQRRMCMIWRFFGQIICECEEKLFPLHPVSIFEYYYHTIKRYNHVRN